MLQTEDYVHLFTFDFSKAFDSVRHSTLMSKIAQLPLENHVHNWTSNFFNSRRHCTKFNNQISQPLPINSSVIQGSAMGPVAFIINASDLHPQSEPNKMFKYADDFYLLVPASNSESIISEIEYISH